MVIFCVEAIPSRTTSTAILAPDTDRFISFSTSQVRAHGPGLAGALFGAGWCFWVDAVLVNAQHGNKLPFLAVRGP